MTDDEQLIESLRDALNAPPLDAAFAARVKSLARRELAVPADAVPIVAKLRTGLSGVLVPALLSSAAVVGTSETIAAAAKIYDGSHDGGSR